MPARVDQKVPSVRDRTEVITDTSARAEELFFELVDTLEREGDPVGVACSLLIQLTRFVSEAGCVGVDQGL